MLYWSQGSSGYHRGTEEAALEKVRHHLEEVGSSLENVVKDLIILKDMEHYHVVSREA